MVSAAIDGDGGAAPEVADEATPRAAGAIPDAVEVRPSERGGPVGSGERVAAPGHHEIIAVRVVGSSHIDGRGAEVGRAAARDDTPAGPLDDAPARQARRVDG